MDKKNLLSIISQLLGCFVIYTALLWFFDAVFDKNYTLAGSTLLQGATFSILFVAWSACGKKRKKKD